jgi:hypothetical protein
LVGGVVGAKMEGQNEEVVVVVVVVVVDVEAHHGGEEAVAVRDLIVDLIAILLPRVLEHGPGK